LTIRNEILHNLYFYTHNLTKLELEIMHNEITVKMICLDFSWNFFTRQIL